MRYRREGDEMKTDSLNLPGYPEASQDATAVIPGTGMATRFFKALGEELRRREWEAEHPEEVRRREVEFPEVAVKEPEDWRYLFGMPSVRSKTKRFLEMAARFNAKDAGFGRENDTLLVLPPEETDERCRKILSKDDSSALSKHYAGCTQMPGFDLRENLDYVRPGTMTIFSDRWVGAERKNVMRHELAHQFIVTLGQMMGNENERRRVQGLPHLSDDSLVSLKARLAKINKNLDSLETFVSTPNGNMKLWGRSDIIEELQRVERDFWKEIKNQEEN